MSPSNSQPEMVLPVLLQTDYLAWTPGLPALTFFGAAPGPVSRTLVLTVPFQGAWYQYWSPAVIPGRGSGRQAFIQP